MAPYVQSELAEKRKEPENQSIEVTIGFNEDTPVDMESIIIEHDGTILEELPFDIYYVEIPDTALDALYNNSHIRSIERKPALEMSDSENFRNGAPSESHPLNRLC